MEVVVALIQGEGLGEPALENKKRIIENTAKLIDEAGSQYHPDFIVLTEMFSTPYFCGVHDNRFFQWAETIPGETTEFLAEKARKYKCHVMGSFFEKVIPGEYYNSAVIVGPDGNLLKGKLPDGKEMDRYRKNHIPVAVMPDGNLVDEKYYFRPGQGFPIFQTPKCPVGCLICYDRSFPESWRSLVLRGAEIVFVMNNSYGFREESFLYELRTRAIENGIFVCASNKGGREVMAFELLHYGISCIIDPFGRVLRQGSAHKGPEIVAATFDLDEVTGARNRLHLLKDRRPEIYYHGK